MIRKILILTFIAMLLAACGGQEASTPVTATEEIEDSSGAATQAPAPTNTPVTPDEAPAAGPTMTSTPEADPRAELGSPT